MDHLSRFQSQLAPFSDLEEDVAECLLLTNDLETEIEVGELTVRCLPVVKYLLGLRWGAP